jgi:hypothetical protein
MRGLEDVIVRAADAGRWDVVAQLARELDQRHEDRRPHQEGAVVAATKKGARLPRKPTSRAELRAAVREACWEELVSLFPARKIVPWPRTVIETMQAFQHPASLFLYEPTGKTPEVEVEAQKAYGRARRAVRALLASVPAGTVAGPCTAFLQERREALEAFTRDAPDGKGSHWRPHTQERSAPILRAIDTWGGTIKSNRKLACIALLFDDLLTGDTPAECIAATTNRVKAARSRTI